MAVETKPPVQLWQRVDARTGRPDADRPAAADAAAGATAAVGASSPGLVWAAGAAGVGALGVGCTNGEPVAGTDLVGPFASLARPHCLHILNRLPSYLIPHFLPPFFT